MTKTQFLTAKDKQGKVQFISWQHVVRISEIDQNSWQIDFLSGAYSVVDAAEIRKFLMKLPGIEVLD